MRVQKPAFLKKVKKVYLVGIKGVAMTALACCFQDLGLAITGSDVEEIFVTDETLKQRKIKWQIGFDEKEILKFKPDLVVTTGAHGGLKNPQVLAAQKAKIKVLTQAQTVGELMEEKTGIAVCGVGGKSTTASIIAVMLEAAHKKPSFVVGVGKIEPLGEPGRYNNSDYFVAEADEYANSPGIDNRPKFSFLKPKVTVVTNIEYDHPDIYQNFDQVKTAYQSFFAQLPPNGLLVACADNQNTSGVVKDFGPRLQTYGFSPQADWRIEKVYLGEGQTIFDLSHQGALIDQTKLKVPGRFNILNASAAFAVGTFLGLDAKVIKEGLASFGGTKRRFELIGPGLYDDYAHHPEEIKATLAAAKKWLPDKKLWVVFQPHTYSRTKALFDEFAHAFVLADQVIITKIYASAREKDDLGMSGRLLAEEVKKYHPRAVYRAGEAEVVEFLKEKTRGDEVVITMGAGDIFLWHKNILKSLKS